jgi:hypothetical protein
MPNTEELACSGRRAMRQARGFMPSVLRPFSELGRVPDTLSIFSGRPCRPAHRRGDEVLRQSRGARRGPVPAVWCTGSEVLRRVWCSPPAWPVVSKTSF